MKLTDYVKAWPVKRPQRAWAADFGISRTYFNHLMSGTRQPSLAVMEQISVATSGLVSPNSWMKARSTKHEHIEP